MLKNAFSTRKIALMGLLVATSAVLTPYAIWLSPEQKLLSFSFLPLAVGAVILGPVPALLMGFASDTINYLIKPMGGYFFGYALSLMMSCLIYALWQYNRPLKLWRIICAQFCNVVLVYFGLNFIWRAMLSGTVVSTFFTVPRLVSNTIQFPFVVFAVYGLSRAILALMKRKPI